MAKGLTPVLLVLGGLALWMLSRGKGEAGPAPGRPSIPQGAIGTVQVSQRAGMAMAHRRGAVMGTHLAPKSIGSAANWTANWTAATKNAQGQPIAWNYAVSWRWLHPPSGSFRSGGFFRIGSRPNGTFLLGPFTDILNSSFPTGDWTLQVTLHADTSSPTGTPNNDAVNDGALLIGFSQHIGAIRISVAVPLRPTDQEIIAAAQALIPTSEPIFSPSFYDTRYFVGLALLDYVLLTVGREFIDDLGGTAGWSWVQALDWWKASGFMR